MFDYVIVGAGSAGCALAARLSEDPGASVLVLEAGQPDEAEEIYIPAAFGKLFGSEFDWAYRTEPEPQLGGREIYQPRGKTLGGSSSTNAMVYIRGHRADYDAWRDLGNPGWGYDDVLPVFKRAENHQLGASDYHGDAGPLSVSLSRSGNPLTDAFVAGAIEAGIPANDDFNAAVQDGVGRLQVTQYDGRRCSSAAAYLHPNAERPNLTVETGVHVTRVLVQDGRAAGVEGVRDGETVRFDAAREVVLCGGTFNSPQLLMLSGIGPAGHLAEHGIEVVRDLAGVGSNLQDHPGVVCVWTTDETTSLLDGEDEKHLDDFINHSAGMLTSNVAEGAAFVRTSSDEPAPNMQLHFAPVMFLGEGLEDPPCHGWTIVPTLLTPQSRGSVRLRSADPFAAPAIVEDYYAAAGDMDAMVEGVRTAMRIAEQPAMAAVRKDGYLIPASDSREDVEAHIRVATQALYHPAGTCAMGPGADAVVDSDLRVHGIDGLRVADASVMPNVIRGNTNAPAIMIGERAADLIGRSWAARTPAAAHA